jgi:hypothetical protein
MAIIKTSEYGGTDMLFRRIGLAALGPTHKDGKEPCEDGEAGSAPEEGFDIADALVAQNDGLARVDGMEAHQELDSGGSQHNKHKKAELNLFRKLVESVGLDLHSGRVAWHGDLSVPER